MFQLTSRSVAEPSTRPTQVVRCQFGNADGPRGLFHDVPDRLFRDALSPYLPNLVDPAEQPSSINAGPLGSYLKTAFWEVSPFGLIVGEKSPLHSSTPSTEVNERYRLISPTGSGVGKFPHRVLLSV